MNEWVGKSLGKVRIDSLLARGGMAEVYLGTHTSLQREVAVKILRNQYEDDQELLERFQREARVVAKLRHQNIVQVFDYDAVDDRPYIVMEFISGPSLSQHLTVLHKKSRRLELSQISRIITGVANALQYAHKSGVVHRDIKPGNIILTSHESRIIPGEPLPHDFQPVLTDFGLVRFLNSSRQTSAGQTAGTPAYMSPEQARGETTDGRTDIYSLGIVLYEMLTGNVPFDGETTMSILLKHITEPPPPFPGLPYPVQQVLDKALAKNTADRFQTPNELSNAFNAASEAGADNNTFMGIATVTNEFPGNVVDTDPALIIIDRPSKPRKNWRQIALGGIALALLGVIYSLNGFAQAPVSETQTLTQTVVTSTSVPIIPISSTLGRTAVLYFRDGDAIMDQAVLEALAIQAPPAGTQYEVWLVGPEGRVSLGILALGSTGKGRHTYNSSTGENLLGKYNQVELIIKPLDASSTETQRLAYSYTLPPDGLNYIRQLLVSDPEVPAQTALIQSLAKDTQLLDQLVRDMQKAYASNDQASIRKNAESIMNILVGVQSQDYKDWDANDQISDPGAGYGFSLDGNTQGHEQTIYAHADYVANSAGASQNMISRSSEVKACAENLAQWIPLLREQAKKILTTTSLSEMEQPVQNAAALVEKIRNGFDLDEDSKIEPVAGECGVATIYESAYAMADMPLLPVNFLGTPISGTGTPYPIGTFYTATPTRGSGGGGGSTQSAPTQLPPGQQKTKEPKATSPGGGGGGGGEGGGGGGGNNGGGNNGGGNNSGNNKQ